jgi:hypothetical protein
MLLLTCGVVAARNHSMCGSVQVMQARDFGSVQGHTIADVYYRQLWANGFSLFSSPGAKLREIFAHLDKDKSGFIDVKELMQTIKQLPSFKKMSEADMTALLEVRAWTHPDPVCLPLSGQYHHAA